MGIVLDGSEAKFVLMADTRMDVTCSTLQLHHRGHLLAVSRLAYCQDDPRPD
jgi:hypothetical protein